MTDTSEPEVGDVKLNAELDLSVWDGKTWVPIPPDAPWDPREIIRNDPKKLIALGHRNQPADDPESDCRA